LMTSTSRAPRQAEEGDQRDHRLCQRLFGGHVTPPIWL
jgi:hypothetical protein